MSPDAKLRMDVYQEGRHAPAGLPCPYTDWRAGTWLKGRLSVQRAQLGPLFDDDPSEWRTKNLPPCVATEAAKECEACRDLFVVGSVSWALLDARLQALLNP